MQISVDFFCKQDLVSRFFDVSTADKERLRPMHDFGVDYVFHGPAERALGDYDPATSSWLELAFSRPQVNVYRVKDEMLIQ